MQKFFSVAFGSLAFFIIIIINVLKGHDLFFCLKQGAVGLFLFLMFGFFFGLMYNMIVEDNTTRTVSKE